MGFKCSKKMIASGSIFLAGAILAGNLAVVNFKKDVKASNVDTAYEETLPMMESVARMYAEEFAESMNENIDLTVCKTTPIYDAADCIIGYSVAFSKDDKDYGYVNVDYTSEGLVSDFSVTNKSDSIYDVLTENFAKVESDIEIEDCKDKLISVNGMDYAVEASDEKKGEIFFYNGTTYESDNFEEMLDHYEENYLQYYDNTEYEDEFVSIDLDNIEEREWKIIKKFKGWLKKIAPKLYDKFFGDDPNASAEPDVTDDYEDVDFIQPTAYPNHSEVFKKEAMCALNNEVYLPQYSKELSLISQETIMKTTNRYACALVGVAAICQQEGMMLNGTLKDTFNKLWDLAGCEANIYETSTFYGTYTVDCSSTYAFQMGQVMREYGKLFNKKVVTEYKDNPKFEFFQNSIDKGNSTSLGYQIKDEGGHGVNVVGYAEARIGNNEIDYLITGDSWYDDAPRYVLYGRQMFASTNSNSYTITDM